MKRFLITAFCTMLVFPAFAQEDALKDLPGFVDFGELADIYGEPKVQISIGGALLGFVGALSKNHDPDAAALFNKLKGVRVNVYRTEEAGTEAAMNQISRIKSSLQSSNWSPIVQVNEEDEQVQIFMKMDGTVMDGLTMMVVDDEEAVFINVIGQLDPNELSQVMDNFDIDIDDAMDIDID